MNQTLFCKREKRSCLRSLPMEFCNPEGIWDKTPVGVTSVVSCRRLGHYYGNLKRHCGSLNGAAVWLSIEGECQPYSKIGFGVIAFILVLILVVCRITYRIITKNSDTKSKTALPMYFVCFCFLLHSL